MTAHATKLKRMDAGLCCGCGEVPPESGKQRCGSCLQRQREQYKAWHERTRQIREADAKAEAEALSIVRAETAAFEAETRAEFDRDSNPGVEFRVIGKDVIRVCDARGEPTLAVIPWDTYLRLLRETFKAKGKPGRPKGSKNGEIHGHSTRKNGRPPIVGAHILKQLIRDYPNTSSAKIAEMFTRKTGVTISRDTVFRYRERAEKHNYAKKRETNGHIPETDAVAGIASKQQSDRNPTLDTGLVINGIELTEYDTLIVETAIRAGARTDTVRESEEYADGLVALYEAAEDFDPSQGQFLAYAAERIRKGISRGKSERRVKVEGSSRRVLNFSEIGGEDFNIEDLIDESGHVV